MNRKSLLLVLGIMILSSCGPSGTSISNSSKESNSIESNNPPKEKMSVILLGGQSNMEGNSYSSYLQSDEELYQELITGYDDILIDYVIGNNTSHDRFMPVNLRRASLTPDKFGPEPSMAKLLHDNFYGNHVCFIKYAVGGTSIYPKSGRASWTPPSEGQEAGELYKNFVEIVRNGLEYLDEKYQVSLDAMCWMQGESDCDNLQMANQYETNLTSFISSLREEFSDYNPNFAFIDAYISDSPNWSFYKTINAAKEKVKNTLSDCYTIDTISEKLTYNKEPRGNPDYAHYDAFSEVKLGYLFAQKYMEIFPDVY